MPAKNVVKEYVEGGVYHVYNRGVEKRDIFIDDNDYKTFLYFLKTYLSNPEILKESTSQKSQKGSTLFKTLFNPSRANFYDEVELLAYCLMPNHYHLLVRQKNKDSMLKFMKCLATNYSMYFNKRHERVGSLFQGVYKAVLVKSDEYLLHISRYIHLNPLKGFNPQEDADPQEDAQGDFSEQQIDQLHQYNWSSYDEYLDKRSTKWVNTRLIWEIFKELSGSLSSSGGFDSYQDFVESYKENSIDFLGKSTLD